MSLSRSLQFWKSITNGLRAFLDPNCLAIPEKYCVVDFERGLRSEYDGQKRSWWSCLGVYPKALDRERSLSAKRGLPELQRLRL